jgi:hypothetical protein
MLFVPVGINGAVLIALSLKPSGAPPTAAAGQPAPPVVGAATWSAVYADLIQRSGCNSGPVCHAGTAAGQLKMSNAAEAYAALVGVKALGAGGAAVACNTTGLLRVAPSDPDNSLLVKKLETATPVCGAAMPPTGMVGPELLQQLRAWIGGGAKND